MMYAFAVVSNLKCYPLDLKKVTHLKSQVGNQAGNFFMLGFNTHEAIVSHFFPIIIKTVHTML